MQNPKQHHIVPRWYLEGFTDSNSGLLHVCDRLTKRYRAQKPNKVMRVNKYYRQEWAPEGIDPYILERLAGELIEPKAKDAFRRLLKMPPDFTPEETAITLVYLEFQRVRVPRQAKMAKHLIESSIFMQANPDFISAYLDGKITISDSARFEYMRQLSGRIIPYFARMKWDIVKAPKGSSFITTDSPVSFYNPELPPPAEAGLKFAGTKVLFPLSSKLILIMRHPEYGINSEVPPKQLVPEPEKRDDGIEVTFYPQPISDEVLNQYNWLLVELLDRTVAGNCREVLEKCLVTVPEPNRAHQIFAFDPRGGADFCESSVLSRNVLLSNSLGLRIPWAK